MTMGAVDRMAASLAVPFHRGADRLGLEFQPGGTGAIASLDAYNFSEHQARFGVTPDPRYVITALRNITVPTRLTVTYVVGSDPAQRTATVEVPAGTLADMSFLLDLGAQDGPAARLHTVAMSPPADTDTVAAWWSIDALLGTLAKLLWVVGWERNSLHAHLRQVRSQSRLSTAVGPSLDLLGHDLGVSRFPPLPYAFEDGTVSLYHLEDATGAGVGDATVLYGGIGHPATGVTATAGAVGRFGRGFAFTQAAAEITVANHADFAVDAATSFTAECFVRAADGTWQGAVLSKHSDPADPTRPGWALSVGAFGRGIPRNIRFLVTDGAHPVELFADEQLPVTRFTHLAGVIDRTAGLARLHVNGAVRAVKPLAGVGALTNSEPVRIGRAAASAANTFQGVVDEVRLSRAARSGFHPVLGESDESYRRRLRIFQRWTLPTPANLRAALNDALNDTFGGIQGVPDPLDVSDEDSTLADGDHTLTVVPVRLAPGDSVDYLGRRRTREVEAAGSAEQDAGFDPALLADGSDARIDFAAASPAPIRPGIPSADPRRMRVGTRRVLRALRDLLTAEAVPGRLRVGGGFDPRAPDLRSVGRALLLTHSNLPTDQLAAFAQRAGFSWIHHRGDVVHASVRSTDTVEIDLNAPGGVGFDLLMGQTGTLAVQPPPPRGALIQWGTIPCGHGRTDFSGRTDQAAATVHPTHPGTVAVRVQVTVGTRSFTATRRVRIGVDALPATQSISDAGAQPADPSIAGAPGAAFFDPAYLVTVSEPRLSFAAGVDTRRMQPAVASRLRLLLDLIAGGGVPKVASAWNPAGSGLDAEGRALTLEPGTVTIPLERLGALAHAAGFTHVTNDGTRLRILQGPDAGLTVTGPDQVEEGTTVRLDVSPRAAPQAAALTNSTVYTANTGTDTVSAIERATGRITGVVKVGATPVAVAASPDGLRVYTADADSNSVTVIEAATLAVAGRVNLSSAPRDLAHHPTTPKLYAALAGNQVVEIDTTTKTVARTLNVTAPPIAIATNPGGTQVWVADQNAVRVIGIAAFTVSATVTLPGAPTSIAVGATRAYVTVPPNKTLQVLTTATPAIQASFTEPGWRPTQMALSPNGTVLYVTDSSGGRVYLRKADGSPQTLPALPPSAAAGRTPVDVAADDHRAYVVNRPRDAVGSTDNVSVLDADRQAVLAAVWPLGTGHGERLAWSVRPLGSARARLPSTISPHVDLLADAAGPIAVHVLYQWPDRTPPYTFEVRFSDRLQALELSGTPVVIRKDQYDLIMNILNELHPVGVEVDTRIIRAHVLELSGSLRDVLPDYTYPDFRMPGRRLTAFPLGEDP
jgi:YVTN family beta-propeller protein